MPENKTLIKKDAYEPIYNQMYEDLYGSRPGELSRILKTKKYSCVVIDEVQKAPKILDIFVINTLGFHNR